MAFTRFNYDKCRTQKLLQEATGPGRYQLNKPGVHGGAKPAFIADPHVRLQEWGANLRHVAGGHPIDIENDLKNIGRYKTRYNAKQQFPRKIPHNNRKVTYTEDKTNMTDQSRATHPTWETRDLEQTRWYPLILDPQENVCKHFHNNLNTRLLERDNYVPKMPCIQQSN